MPQNFILPNLHLFLLSICCLPGALKLSSADMVGVSWGQFNSTRVFACAPMEISVLVESTHIFSPNWPAEQFVPNGNVFTEEKQGKQTPETRTNNPVLRESLMHFTRKYLSVYSWFYEAWGCISYNFHIVRCPRDITATPKTIIWMLRKMLLSQVVLSKLHIQQKNAWYIYTEIPERLLSVLFSHTCECYGSWQLLMYVSILRPAVGNHHRKPSVLSSAQMKSPRWHASKNPHHRKPQLCCALTSQSIVKSCELDFTITRQYNYQPFVTGYEC